MDLVPFNSSCLVPHVPRPQESLDFSIEATTGGASIWPWLKVKQEGLRGFWSMFPLAKVPFWYRFFEPQPYVC